MKAKGKRIFFVQLPLLDHALSYIGGNVPYAGAAIKGFIKNHVNAAHSVEQLPYMLANFASNKIIAEYIHARQPQIICFTVYLWNAERSLALAQMLRQMLPSAEIIFGGPEVAAGSMLFTEERPYVDAFVSGEGEWFFDKYLAGKSFASQTVISGVNKLIVQPADELIPAHKIVEPFTAGFLDTMPDSSIFIEMTRGCPYRCSYCYYSKSCLTVREQPIETLLAALAEYERVKEIYILAPTFDRSPNFLQNLKIIAAENFGISLHTEMRADRINKQTATLLKQAGFNSLEIGLQSLNKTALAAVRRGANPDAELRGMERLREAGIDIKIGIIPGLPDDTPDTFAQTVDTLVRRGFAENIELYPLMILPGTEIREAADAANAEYLRKPPYFYLSGWGMDADDIRSITKKTELSTGFGQSVVFLPNFALTSKGSLIKAAAFNGNTPAAWQPDKYAPLIETACFDFHITCENEPMLLAGLPTLLAGLPLDTLFTFVLYGEKLFNENKIAAIVNRFTDNDIFSRMNIFNSAMEASRIKFFQVFAKVQGYVHGCRYEFVHPVLRADSDNFNAAAAFILDNNPDDNFVLAAKDLGGVELSALMMFYKNSPDMIAFEDSAAMQKFCKISGCDMTDTGFDLRIVQM